MLRLKQSSLVFRCLRSRMLSLIPEFKDEWQKGVFDENALESWRDVSSIPCESPSNTKQRGNYLGIANEYIPEIKCELRTMSRHDLKLARQNDSIVPCVLKGKLWKKNINSSVKFQIKQWDVINHYSKREAMYYVTPHKLIFENSPEHNCYAFVKTVDWHIEKQKADHVEFLRFDPENKERRMVNLPITYWNEAKSPGLRYNGWLNKHMRELPIWVDSLDFPTRININLTGMEHGETVFVKDVTIPPTISVYRKAYKKLLCSVKKVPRGDDD